MKLFKSLFCLVALLGLLAVLTGCPKSAIKADPKGMVYFSYFDTVSYIYCYSDDSQEEFEANCGEASGILEKYHKLFDIYYEHSGITNLRTLNLNAGGEPMKVERELIDFLLYAKELLEKGEQDHARQRLYSAVISSEELFKKNGQREELQALEEAHKLLSESFFSSGMLLEAETHFEKYCDVKKKQTGEDPLLLLANFYEQLVDAAARKKDLSEALRLADKGFDCWRTLLQSDPQNESYKTGFERIATKEHQLKAEDSLQQAKDIFSDIEKKEKDRLKKEQEKIRSEAQKTLRWEEFFAGGKELKIEPSYKELNYKPHLFIDFVQADEAKAKKIIAHLREHGYRVAYTTKGGLFQKPRLKEQVKKSTVFLPLISQSYLKERGDQLGQLCSWYGVHDCFIYLEKCELPKELRLRLAAKDNLKTYTFQSPHNFFTALYNTNKVNKCK